MSSLAPKPPVPIESNIHRNLAANASSTGVDSAFDATFAKANASAIYGNNTNCDEYVFASVSMCFILLFLVYYCIYHYSLIAPPIF